MKEAEAGYEIQVGDIIQIESFVKTSHHKVHRVTPKRAYMRWNDVAEGIFPRIYTGFGYKQIGNNNPYSTVKYRVLIS